MTRTQHYLLVVFLSFQFAPAVRHVLGRMLQEDLITATMSYVRTHKKKPLFEPLRVILSDTEHLWP